MRLFYALCASITLAVSFFPAISHAASQLATLDLADAEALIEKGKALALESKVPICIAVVDTNGSLIAFERMDNAPISCIDGAIAKAHAAAIYRLKTSIVMRQVNSDGTAVADLPGMLAVGGGAPVQDDQKSVLGAVGVSGAINQIETKIAESVASTYGNSTTKPQ